MRDILARIHYDQTMTYSPVIYKFKPYDVLA